MMESSNSFEINIYVELSKFFLLGIFQYIDQTIIEIELYDGLTTHNILNSKA